MMDRATKIIGAVVGISSLGGTIVAVMFWAGGRASASVVEQHESRLTKVETRADAEREWRVWTVEQLSAVSARLGVPVLPPPVMPPTEKQHVDRR